MKKLVIICVSLVMLICTVQGKSQTLDEFRRLPPQQKAQRIADTLKVGLHLSEAQYIKVYDIAYAITQKSDPIMNGDGDRRAKGRQLIPLWRDAEKSMKATLTSGQIAVYEQKRKALIAEAKANLGKQKIHFN